MKITDLGIVIAERVLDGHLDDKPCTVVVKIGKPFFGKDAVGHCWYCPYSISVEADQRIFYGAGEDSLQALSLAIKMIGAELNSIYRDLKLTWLGDTDLGFSVSL